MTEFIIPSLLNLIEPLNIVLMLLGLTGGIIIGALPGLSATMGVALMVPATFALDPISGLIMLGAIYAGAIYGGANSAILICTPGTPSSVATTFDGWPLTQQGRADVGLYTSLLSSAFGGIVGTIFLLCLAASLARFALQFGGPENFWLCLFGLSTIAVMTPDNMGKGILSGAIGLLISTIGLDPNTGSARFTFGTYALIQGVAVIPCMIGLFSFSQVLYLIGTDKTYIAEYRPQKGNFLNVFKYLVSKCKVVLLRSSIIGTGVGMLPGAGGEIASIISYNEAKRWSDEPSRYGKGCIEGVAASESANNAVIGGSLIPMLTLGIPGSAVAAVILGALMAHGVQPGFKIFSASGELAYSFIFSQFAVNLLMIPVGFVLCRCMARLLSLRLTLVAIAIVVLAYIGAYAINNSLLDIWVVFVFGLLGFAAGKVHLDTGAMALGVILGPMIEENLGKCFDLSRAAHGGLLQVMFEGGINKTLVVALLLSLLTPIVILRKNRRNRRQKEETASTAENAPTTELAEHLPHHWGADVLAGVICLAIALAFGLQYEGLEGVSAIFPEVLCSIIAAGGLYFVVKGLFKRGKNLRHEKEEVAWKNVFLITLAGFLYAIGIVFLGFYSSTILYIVLISLALMSSKEGIGKTSVKALIFAAVFSLAIWICFTNLLNVPTPTGFLF